MFAEVFAGSLEETNQRLTKLLGYARTVCRGSEAEIEASHRAARDAGWSEQALFETVEVCGVFNYINCIVRAANLPEPEGRPASLPQQTDLRGSYKNMAKSITN
jgi:alkylhydroperoxidase family enzyme